MYPEVGKEPSLYLKMGDSGLSGALLLPYYLSNLVSSFCCLAGRSLEVTLLTIVIGELASPPTFISV